MPTITQNVTDVTGAADNSPWTFSSVLRDGDDGIITPKRTSVKPIAGLLTVEMEPGPATVTFNNQTYAFTVGVTDSDLWSLIAAGVATPPNTSADALASAIATYLTTHPATVSPVMWFLSA